MYSYVDNSEFIYPSIIYIFFKNLKTFEGYNLFNIV